MRRALLSIRRSCRFLRQRPIAGREPLQHARCAAALEGAEGENQTGARASVLPFALGAGIAAAWIEEAQCEQAGDHKRLADVKLRVMNAWVEVEQDLDRLEASFPFPVPRPRAKPPEVQLKDGQIAVSIAIQGRVQTGELVQDLVAALAEDRPSRSSQGSSITVEVPRESGAAVLALKDPARPGFNVRLRSPTTERSTLAVDFVYDDEEEVGEEDLAAMAVAMRAAHGVRIRQHSGARIFAQDFSPGALFAQQVRSIFGEEMAAWEDAFGQLERFFQPPVLDGETLPGPGLRPQPTSEASSILKEQARPSGHDYGSAAANAAVEKLEQLGAVVYPPSSKDAVDWGILAGYEEQKEQIEETLLLALLHPEVYKEVSSSTRRLGGGNRPRAVLFEGPPGCGKTTSARVLASQASAPLIYVPIEAIASKWYGESEKILGDIFKAAEQLETCLVFLDEIDSLATQRSSEMHEATRRILGVLLRQLDGFEGKRSIVIGATNRKQDLDPALLSRFDASIYFQLPNQANRQQILAQYAKQLSQEALEELAGQCEGLSGRDLRDVCEQAERRTASKIIKKLLPRGSLPGLEDYLLAAKARQREKRAPPVFSPQGFYGTRASLA